MESKKSTNSNEYSDITVQNILSKGEYKDRIISDAKENLYFDSINYNFCSHACSSNVGPLPSTKLL